MKRVALFGTSADPPTAGHAAIIKWLSERYDSVAVWTADNPFKSHKTSLEHRGAMLRLLIEDIDAARQNVSFHPEFSSYRTLETVQKAKRFWGADAELTLVVGSDLVSQLPRWYRIEDLLRQVVLLVVPRPLYAIAENDLERLRQLGGAVTIADFTGPDVSSTAYRENGDAQSLIPPIEAYIHQQHLYKCQNAAQKSLQIR